MSEFPDVDRTEPLPFTSAIYKVEELVTTVFASRTMGREPSRQPAAVITPPGMRARRIVTTYASRKTARLYVDVLDTLVDEWQEAAVAGDWFKARLQRLKAWPLMIWVWLQVVAAGLRRVNPLARASSDSSQDADSKSDDSQSS